MNNGREVRTFAFRNMSQAALIEESNRRLPALIVYRGKKIGFFVPWPNDLTDWQAMTKRAIDEWKKAGGSMIVVDEDAVDEEVEKPPLPIR